MNKLSLIIIILCFSGCALFQQTNKGRASTAQSSVKQLEATELVLKRAGKETQIFTYWNDSGFYQLQYVKEQMEQTETGQLKLKQEDQLKNKVSVKKKEPLKTGFYILFAAVLFLVFIFFFKKTGFSKLWHHK